MVLGKAAFIATTILMIIIRFPYGKRGKTDSASRPQTDRQEQLLLMLLTVGGLLPLIYIFTGWLAFADYSPSPWVVGTGIAVTIVGLWLFWRSHADLGHNWSSTLETYEDHRLITQGIYQRIRHPMYSASWLIYAGQALILSNWIAGFSGIVTFGILYFLRVPEEEQMMLEKFGDEYQRYMSRTGRVIPKRGFTP